MKSWVVYDSGCLWKVCRAEDEARAFAATRPHAHIKGFDFGNGDWVKDKEGNILLIERPAISITGGFGYKVSGGRYDFLHERDVVKSANDSI